LCTLGSCVDIYGTGVIWISCQDCKPNASTFCCVAHYCGMFLFLQIKRWWH